METTTHGIYVVAMEETRDKNTAIFHSVSKMTNHMTENMMANSYDSDEFSPVARLIINLPGVEGLTLQPYKVIVSKAALFNWPDLAKPILGIMLDWHNTNLFLAGAAVSGREVAAVPAEHNVEGSDGGPLPQPCI